MVAAADQTIAGVPCEHLRPLHFVGAETILVRIRVTERKRREKIVDSKNSTIREYTVRFPCDGEMILQVAQIKTEAENDEIEFAVSKGQFARRSHRQSQIPVSRCPVLDRIARWIDAMTFSGIGFPYGGQPRAGRAPDFENTARRYAEIVKPRNDRIALRIEVLPVAMKPCIAFACEKYILLLLILHDYARFF